MKEMMIDIEKSMKGRKEKMIREMKNVRKRNIMDRKMLDFEGMMENGEKGSEDEIW